MSDYTAFLASKAAVVQPSGFDVDAAAIHPSLFPFHNGIIVHIPSGDAQMAPIKDLVGQRFGRLTVRALGGWDARRKNRVWLCDCDCGQTTEVSGSNLRTGNTASCGCLHRERQREIPTRHGGRKTREYVTWLNMIQRCTNPKASGWSNYGERGIRVCDRWRDFANFIADMGSAPLGSSIERINGDGNYEPANCRWATASEQARNLRTNRVLTHQGKTQTLVEWSEEIGVSYWTLHSRLRRGWPTEKVLSP